EQRAMILSTYRQYVYNGGMLSLEAFLAGALFWWQQPFELAQYSYDRVVAHYHERFGSENVLVLPYELFRRDGFRFVSRIVDFAVGDCYRESNARTANLTGLDLAAYGYDLPQAQPEHVGAP